MLASPISEKHVPPESLEMYVKKRRLHVVPSFGSDRLKRHFREGSVAGISHIRKAYVPREVGKNVKIHVIVEI